LLKNISLSDSEKSGRFLLIDWPFKVNSKQSIAWHCILLSKQNGYGDIIFARFYSEYGEKILDKKSSFERQTIKNA
jgi:hypothetical protein